jgi:hypothetical protein
MDIIIILWESWESQVFCTPHRSHISQISGMDPSNLLVLRCTLKMAKVQVSDENVEPWVLVLQAGHRLNPIQLEGTRRVWDTRVWGVKQNLTSLLASR